MPEHVYKPFVVVTEFLTKHYRNLSLFSFYFKAKAPEYFTYKYVCMCKKKKAYLLYDGTFWLLI